MLKFRESIWTLLGVVLICILLNLWWNTRLLMQNSQETLKNLRDTTTLVKDYIAAEKARLENPMNTKAIDAAIQMGGVWNGVGRATNTLVIPRILKQLDSATASTEALTTFIRGMDAGTRESFRQLNDILLPDMHLIAENVQLISTRTGADLVTINQEIVNLIQSGQTTVEEVNKRLADPKFDELLQNSIELQRGAQRLVDQSGNVAENLANTTAEFPAMTKRFRKFQPLLIGLNLAALLRQIFLP